MQLAKVLTDSISPDNDRLTTLEVKLPRYLLEELNTHKILSKNSASSRARPIRKTLADIMENPHMPSWGKAGKGMQDHGDMPVPSRELVSVLANLREVGPATEGAEVPEVLSLSEAEQKVVRKITKAWRDAAQSVEAQDAVDLLIDVGCGHTTMAQVGDQLWLEARDAMASKVKLYDLLGFHKQNPTGSSSLGCGRPSSCRARTGPTS